MLKYSNEKRRKSSKKMENVIKRSKKLPACTDESNATRESINFIDLLEPEAVNQSNDGLRRLFREYLDAERNLMATSPMLFESDQENYSDSYKWLRFPTQDEYPETVSYLNKSDVELFPNDRLAGLLLAVLKNQVPSNVQMQGVSIDRVGTSFRFCISGSTSLEALQILFGQNEPRQDFEDERKPGK